MATTAAANSRQHDFKTVVDLPGPYQRGSTHHAPRTAFSMDGLVWHQSLEACCSYCLSSAEEKYPPEGVAAAAERMKGHQVRLRRTQTSWPTLPAAQHLPAIRGWQFDCLSASSGNAVVVVVVHAENKCQAALLWAVAVGPCARLVRPVLVLSWSDQCRAVLSPVCSWLVAGLDSSSETRLFKTLARALAALCLWIRLNFIFGSDVAADDDVCSMYACFLRDYSNSNPCVCVIRKRNATRRQLNPTELSAKVFFWSQSRNHFLTRRVSVRLCA